jgi:hypothetical protein
MPRASSTPRHPEQLAASGFAAEQWRLLSKLPAEVMIATVSLWESGPRRGAASAARAQRRTVAEGLAGLDAIAAGRWSDSDLVRAVVAAIYAEPEEDPPMVDLAPALSGAGANRGAGAEATDLAPSEDPLAQRARMLAGCRRVVAVLRASADPADSAAYRHWVEQVAVRVCRAAQSGGAPVTGAADRFLDELGAALR